MRDVDMKVWLIGKPDLDWVSIREWMAEIGAEDWLLDKGPELQSSSQGDALVELAGRRCYKSFGVGLNPNVTRIREDSRQYLQDGIIATGHGSVLEHAQFTFAIENCSRVLTHELVRHRVGVAISQESMRYVRLDDIPFWWPTWAREDVELHERGQEVLAILEDFQLWMADHFKLDDEGVPFAEKKHKTSFMRRFAPDGVTTGMVWSCNIRELRHVIQARTDIGAEEEIRIFGAKIGELLIVECPYLFSDFQVSETGEWTPKRSKV